MRSRRLKELNETHLFQNILFFLYSMQWTTGKNKPIYGSPQIHNQTDTQYILRLLARQSRSTAQFYRCLTKANTLALNSDGESWNISIPLHANITLLTLFTYEIRSQVRSRSSERSKSGGFTFSASGRWDEPHGADTQPQFLYVY